MGAFQDEIFEKRARHAIENLKKKNIKGIYCKTAQEANKEIIKMIPEGSLVGLGGSTSLIESGLLEELRKQKFEMLDRYLPGLSQEEIYEMRVKGLNSDVYISGANAVTLKGQILNCDGMGNRVASIVFGPKKVILIVGVNKIVNTLDDAFDRIHTYAAPMNAVRFNADTPCRKNGICDDDNCFPPGRLCNVWSLVEAQGNPDRMNVVFIGQSLGF